MKGTITVDGSDRSLVDRGAEQRFDDWASYFEDDIFDPYASGTVSWSATSGKVTIDPGSASTLVWKDRSSVLLGFDEQPGDSLTTGSTFTSTMVPAGAIWLMGAEIEDIHLERESVFEHLSHRRSAGYHFGGRKVFRWKLRMHSDAMRSFDMGWCSSGTVTIHMGNGLEISSSQGGGYVSGWVIGVENIRPASTILDIYEVNLIMAVRVA